MQKRIKSHFEDKEQYGDYRIKGLAKEKSIATKKKKTSKKLGKMEKGDWDDRF